MYIYKISQLQRTTWTSQSRATTERYPSNIDLLWESHWKIFFNQLIALLTSNALNTIILAFVQIIALAQSLFKWFTTSIEILMLAKHYWTFSAAFAYNTWLFFHVDKHLCTSTFWPVVFPRGQSWAHCCSTFACFHLAKSLRFPQCVIATLMTLKLILHCRLMTIRPLNLCARLGTWCQKTFFSIRN